MASKQHITISIDTELLKQARERGLTLSPFFNTSLKNELIKYRIPKEPIDFITVRTEQDIDRYIGIISELAQQQGAIVRDGTRESLIELLKGGEFMIDIKTGERQKLSIRE